MAAIASTPPYSGPDYARGNQLYKVRAQRIIARNNISKQPCTVCASKNHACYRDDAFKKCAYCTAREITQPYCHSPEEPEPPRKERRKMDRHVLTSYLAESILTKPTRSPSADPEVESNAAAMPMESQVKDEELPNPDQVLDSSDTEITHLQGIPAARFEQLLTTVSQLTQRVDFLESITVYASADAHFKRPLASQSTKKRGPPRRLDSSMLHTLPQVPYDQTFQASPFPPQTYLPPMSPEPNDFYVPYTEAGEDGPDGTPPEHTIRHTSAFRPINCICSRPHTLENSGIQFPRDGSD